MRESIYHQATALLLLAVSAARAEVGVTETEVVLGERSAFSGPSAGLGVELWRGQFAAFSEANDNGGVNGRRIRLVLADDGYDAEKAAPAAAKLILKDRVFLLFGGVGTPTIVKVLPVILKFYNSEGLFQFANFTGAQPQREPPYDKVVFNVRASYREETRAMVNAFVAMGRKRIGIFVQDDAYGTSGRDGVKRSLAAQNHTLAADTTYPRGQTFEVSTEPQLRLLREANVDAIIAVGAYQACAALVRDARRLGWYVPIHNVSFVGADQMLSLLLQEEKRSGQTLTRNLLTTQVVPSYYDLTVPLVREYRAAIEKYRPTVPREFSPGPYQPSSPYSFGSLEGYLDARVFLAILRKAGPSLTRKGFYDAAQGMGRFDVALGTPLEFSPTKHQGLDKVWFTYAGRQGWTTTNNPASVIQ